MFEDDPEERKRKRTRKLVREYRTAMANVATMPKSEDGWLPPCVAKGRGGVMLGRKHKKAS